MPKSSNADLAEIAKFSQSAERWWDLDSDFRALHDINPVRLDWINRTIPVAGQRAVDIGCGGGILSEGLSKLGAHVTGVDLSEQSLDVARSHALSSGCAIDYQLSAVEQFAAKHSARFDVVTCLEMLEHVPDPNSIVSACAALVKPGGHVFFSTINRNPKAYLLAVVGGEYLLRLLPRGTHDYAKFIRPAELASYCRNAGLVVDEIVGMNYDPFLRRTKLSDDTSVNYLLRARRVAV